MKLRGKSKLQFKYKHDPHLPDLFFSYSEVHSNTV